MRVLIVKTSSLGDVVHTFPALSDASKQIPDIRFDWVVEQPFVSLPALHSSVDRVIPSAVRQWRESWIKTWLAGDWKRFRQNLQSRHYDAVIDAQGLIKSALITSRARGPKHGYDKRSIREPQASRFYDRKYAVSKEAHAVERIRQLFSRVLQYPLKGLKPEYGLQAGSKLLNERRSILLLHGTTWHSKQWPNAFWIGIARQASQAGFNPIMLAGNDSEKKFAELIAQNSNARLLPPHSLSEIIDLLQTDIAGFVSVDTGLAHLATGFDVPGISLYGATDAELTGIYGISQHNCQASIDCSPCFKRDCMKLRSDSGSPPCTLEAGPQEIWLKLMEMMSS